MSWRPRSSFDNFARRYFPTAPQMAKVLNLFAVRWVLARRWHRQIFFRLAFRLTVWLCHLGAGPNSRLTVSPNRNKKKR